MIDRLGRTLVAIVLACAAMAASAQVTLTRGTNFSVDVTADGRIAFDLLGKIRLLPAGGGLATDIPAGPTGASRPRWSPNADALVFQARTSGLEQLWLFRLGEPASKQLSSGEYFDQHASWHPAGDKVVFSSDRRDTGFDLWELDIATGLAWRLSQLPGDETEPAWSANGEDLIFIHESEGTWSLVLRRRGERDTVLESSTDRLSSPSWRPDGSLVTFLRHRDNRIVTEMVILSNPLLIRPLIDNEDFFVAPVAWQDRQSMLYASNGFIRTRNFNSWSSRNIPFRVTVLPERTSTPTIEPRELPLIDPPAQRWVLRAARLLDGTGGGYRSDLDIVIDGARIAAIEPARERPGEIIVDMGDLTALPGFIDAHATLPGDMDATLGPVLLAFGLTTMVVDSADAEQLNRTWSGQAMPGPRVLGADWLLDLEPITAINPGINSLPTSPQGIRYEEARLGAAAAPATVLSGLADSRTPGLAALLDSRQALLLDWEPSSVRRFGDVPQLARQTTSVVLGSAANGLGAGVGLHAELRALQGAGLDPEHVLRTAGINAASALGLGLQVGRVAPGASADIVIVDGDPLANVLDALKVVGVVRNGRFFSTIGLIERAQTTDFVE